MSKKLTYEEVKHKFEERGYELLENEWVNSTTKMRYRCPHHPDKPLSMIYNSFQRGRGCPYCGGRAKLTYEFVKQKFEDRGYELLETEYVNCETKMHYRCPHHFDEELSIKYNNFQSGQGCPYCGGKAKLTYEEVKASFKEYGYELLETEYINSKTKMRCRCPYHPDKILSIRYNDINRKSGCHYCGGSRAKLTFEEVKQKFEERGYELLENEYINNSTKMRYKCPHHLDKEGLSITYGNFQSGQGCPYCGGRVKLTYEEVKSKFEERGYELLETEYVNCETKMRYKCPHHLDKIIKICYNDFNNGHHGCPYCGGTKKLIYEEVKALFEERGYELLEIKYKNARTPMKYRCPYHCDKEISIAYHALKLGQGCPYCGGTKKITYEEVKRSFDERGYELLETEYKNIMSLLQYKCLKHPNKINKICYNDLKYNHGCPYCGIEKRMGNNAYNWKGGITELNVFLRSIINNWRYKIFNKYKHRCAITNIKGGKRDLHIHHMTPFSLIRDNVLFKFNIPVYSTIGEYTSEQLNLLTVEFLKEHNEIEGIPLKDNIHLLFHSKYGKTPSPGDFEEFKKRWYAGEFCIIK
jgi:hypothetical protein